VVIDAHGVASAKWWNQATRAEITGTRDSTLFPETSE